MKVNVNCPSCGSRAVFLSPAGSITCSVIGCPDPDVMRNMIPKPHGYADVGLELGKLLSKKDAAYGSSFAVAGKFLELLWPGGVPVKAYSNMLVFARMFDKMKRVATDQDVFGEDPYLDIAGYGILMSELRKLEKTIKGDPSNVA